MRKTKLHCSFPYSSVCIFLSSLSLYVVQAKMRTALDDLLRLDFKQRDKDAKDLVYFSTLDAAFKKFTTSMQEDEHVHVRKKVAFFGGADIEISMMHPVYMLVSTISKLDLVISPTPMYRSGERVYGGSTNSGLAAETAYNSAPFGSHIAISIDLDWTKLGGHYNGAGATPIMVEIINRRGRGNDVFISRSTVGYLPQGPLICPKPNNKQ